MKITRTWGGRLLAIWLLLIGLLPLLTVNLPVSDTALNVLAAIAGLLILLDR
jgi:hypothetical protein